MGRLTRHSRSTTFGVKPTTDSSEVAVTSPSFVSAVQAGGYVEGKAATGQLHRGLLIVWPLPTHARPDSRAAWGKPKNWGRGDGFLA